MPLTKYYKTHTFGYVNTILVSTVFSILFHIYEESNHSITILDFFCAGLWGLYDVYMGYTYTNQDTLLKIMFLNIGSFLIHTQIPYNVYYTLTHSLWHFINAYKCYYISWYIRIGLINLNYARLEEEYG